MPARLPPLLSNTHRGPSAANASEAVDPGQFLLTRNERRRAATFGPIVASVLMSRRPNFHREWAPTIVTSLAA